MDRHGHLGTGRAIVMIEVCTLIWYVLIRHYQLRARIVAAM